MKRSRILIPLLSSFIPMALLLAQSEGGKIRVVTPEESQQMISNDSTVVLLDVRSEEEYRGDLGHLPNALLIPLQDLQRRVDELDSLKSRPMIVYCHSGSRSRLAATILQSKGFNVWSLEGGISRWNDEHRSVVHESPTGK